MAGKRKYVISMGVLPGEPLDGSGQICTHLFVPEPTGKFVEPMVSYTAKTIDETTGEARDEGRVERLHGGLACDPNRNFTPVKHNGVIYLTSRTADPRAVNCPRCKATEKYRDAMRKLEEP